MVWGGLMDNLLAEQEDLREHIYNIAQDMESLYGMLKSSVDRADDFTDIMQRAHWEEWKEVVKEAKDRAAVRRTEMDDTRSTREWDRQRWLEQKASDAVDNRERRNGPIFLR